MSFLNENFREKIYFPNKEYSLPYLMQIIQKPLEENKFIDTQDWLYRSFRFGGKTSEYGGFKNSAVIKIAKIMSFKGMGSSEFEWGSVPSAFDYFLDNINSSNLNTFSFKLKNYPINVYVFCDKRKNIKIKNFINKISVLDDSELFRKKDIKLREPPYFKYSLENVMNNIENNNLGWLELGNPFAFFIDENMFKNFLSLFRNNSYNYIFSDY